jgi:hypothetical protein
MPCCNQPCPIFLTRVCFFSSVHIYERKGHLIRAENIPGKSRALTRTF